MEKLINLNPVALGSHAIPSPFSQGVRFLTGEYENFYYPIAHPGSQFKIELKRIPSMIPFYHILWLFFGFSRGWKILYRNGYIFSSCFYISLKRTFQFV
jgi:hypothetical protein